jgi:hypothetical protein
VLVTRGVSIKNICKFKTHIVKGDREARPRYVSTFVPTAKYAQIEAYAAKIAGKGPLEAKDEDVSEEVLGMLQYTVKMYRAFSVV